MLSEIDIQNRTISQLQQELQQLKHKHLAYASQRSSLQQLQGNLHHVRNQRLKAKDLNKKQSLLQKDNILTLSNELDNLRLLHRQKALLQKDLLAQCSTLTKTIQDWSSQAECTNTRCHNISEEKLELEKENQMLLCSLETHQTHRNTAFYELQRLEERNKEVNETLQVKMGMQHALDSECAGLTAGLGQKQDERRQLQIGKAAIQKELQEFDTHLEGQRMVLKQIVKDIKQVQSKIDELSFKSRICLEQANVEKVKLFQLEACCCSIQKSTQNYVDQAKVIERDIALIVQQSSRLTLTNTEMSGHLAMLSGHCNTLKQNNTRLISQLQRLNDEDEALSKLLQRRAMISG